MRLMRLLRCISAIVLLLAIALGSSGYAPKSAGPQDDTTSGMAASMTLDGTMPDCPACDPDDSMGPICAPSCLALSAILPPAAVAPVTFTVPDVTGAAASRLAGEAAGPEPHPPKASLPA
jgi:hypothetical protein